MPAVSLIIVSLDRHHYLRACLRSLHFQTLENFEIIVVSAQPLADGDALPAHKHIRFTEANISAARNKGIAEARAPIIAFCDDDATPDPIWLARISAPFWANETVGAAGGYCRGQNGIAYQWKTLGFDEAGFDQKMPTLKATKVFAASQRPYIKTVGTNCAFLRKALVDIGGFDESFRYFLDEADVNLRLQKAGWSTAVVPSAEVHHITAPSRFRDAARRPKSLIEIAASHAYFGKKHLGSNAQITASCNDFLLAQTKRLKAMFNIGRISATSLKKLCKECSDGFERGLARSPEHPKPSTYVDTGSSEKAGWPERSIRKVYLEKFDKHDKDHRRSDHEVAYLEVKFSPWPRDARIYFDADKMRWVMTCGYGGRFYRTEKIRAVQTRERLTQQAFEFCARASRKALKWRASKTEPWLLDLSRLVSRMDREVDTGIDRVERAYLADAQQDPNSRYLVRFYGRRIAIF